MGLNFASRMKDETGASVAEVACCFAMAREVFGLEGTPVRFIIRERGEGKK
jgi:NAD-specific glutamate dehydrogenase